MLNIWIRSVPFYFFKPYVKKGKKISIKILVFVEHFLLYMSRPFEKLTKYGKKIAD